MRSRLDDVLYVLIRGGSYGAALPLSAAARSLSAAKIMRMSDRGVENVFLRLRWPETDGKPVCPGCGCRICYACRRPSRLAAMALQSVPR